MARHNLKTWRSDYEAIECGDKTFEVRFNDRDYAVGDILCLRKWDPHESRQMADDRGLIELMVRVTYVMPGGRWGIDPSWCVLGFYKIDDP